VVGVRIGQLEKHNRHLYQNIKELENQLHILQEETRLLEEETTSLSAKKDLLGAKLEAVTEEKNALLRYKMAVEASLGWRMLVKYREARDFILPEGSLRREVLWDSWTWSLKGVRRKDKWKRGMAILKTSGVKGLWQHLRAYSQKTDAYKTWVLLNTPPERDLDEMRIETESWQDTPLISVVMPVYKTPLAFLKKAIESVTAQVYPCWELCIADDGSNDSHIERLLREYSDRDKRIKVKFLPENGGISVASNAALELATGEFVALLDHDDELAPHALYRVAKVIREQPDIDMIYSDEDKLAPNGERCDPFFKPNWSPDLFLSQMYTCHLGVYRRSILEKIGGFRSEYNGSQDYDMVLRFTEKTTRVSHISDILYHWRVIPGSCAESTGAKPFAYDAAKKALRDTLRRRNL